MSEQCTAAELRDDYLRRLDAAMGSLPHALAVDIRSGIAEELDGLDETAMAGRIAELGAPADVASAAAAEASAAPPTALSAGLSSAPSAHVDPRQSPLETRGFAIASAIALGLGGLVVPVAGWLVGIGMVSYSRMWRLREKLWAVFAPFLAVALSWAIFLATDALTADATPDCVGVCPPVANPLVPAVYDMVWSGVIFGYIIGAPLGGLWLLLRLRGRTRPIGSAAAA